MWRKGVSKINDLVQIKITFLSPFDDLVDERKFTIDLQQGNTFKDLIDNLSQKFKGFPKEFFDGNDKINEQIAVLRNGMNISSNNDAVFSELISNNESYVFLTILEMG